VNLKGRFRLPTSMLFVVSSNVDKVDPATRKLIRSHVMLGKKKKKRGESNSDKRVIRATPAHISPVRLKGAMETFNPLLYSRAGSDMSFVDFAKGVEPSIAMNLNITRCQSESVSCPDIC